MLLAFAVFLFSKNIKKLIRNIRLGRDINRLDNVSERLNIMTRVALGQSKIMARPIAGFLHVIVYLGFIIINIEVLEIIIDGLFGTHRVFSFMGEFYNFLIGSFEILAFAVLVSCIIFLIRRNLIKIPRFLNPEITKWPKTDANLILVIEILLMSAFLLMNAADAILQSKEVNHYIKAGSFPISSILANLFENLNISVESLIFVERSTWWFHIIGILAFLNYLPYSKHLHIVLAFPNVFYSNLKPKGQFNNMQSVTNEVKLMFDPAAVVQNDVPSGKFGANDIKDLSWKNLMDAYSCTECGRCTSECPANITGKLLSPRKIMMDTRDRIEEVGKNIEKNGQDYDDGKSLFSYITKEEILACTSCNACVQACPVNIDPLSIIMELRRYKIMEESSAPSEWNNVFSNMENNGAPWQFSPADRLNWRSE